MQTLLYWRNRLGREAHRQQKAARGGFEMGFSEVAKLATFDPWGWVEAVAPPRAITENENAC
jgi:hypothetical protein